MTLMPQAHCSGDHPQQADRPKASPRGPHQGRCSQSLLVHGGRAEPRAASCPSSALEGTSPPEPHKCKFINSVITGRGIFSGISFLILTRSVCPANVCAGKFINHMKRHIIWHNIHQNIHCILVWFCDGYIIICSWTQLSHNMILNLIHSYNFYALCLANAQP